MQPIAIKNQNSERCCRISQVLHCMLCTDDKGFPHPLQHSEGARRRGAGVLMRINRIKDGIS